MNIPTIIGLSWRRDQLESSDVIQRGKGTALDQCPLRSFGCRGGTENAGLEWRYYAPIYIVPPRKSKYLGSSKSTKPVLFFSDHDNRGAEGIPPVDLESTYVGTPYYRCPNAECAF